MAILCVNCKAVLDRHYCLECGVPLLIQCPGCNFSIKQGARFCHLCGLQVDYTRMNFSTKPSTLDEGKLRERIEKFPFYGYHCPICGIHNRMEKAFRCGRCGDSFICKKHLRTEEFVCEQCLNDEASQRLDIPSEGYGNPIHRPDPNRKQEESGFEGMVYVPEGVFLMGDERRKVFVEAFYIDPFPVTNAKYKEFDPYHSFPPEKANCPIHVSLSWFHAKSYALWAGKRLPTEEEWEKAARETDGRIFPWGNDYDVNKCNTTESNILEPTPVGSYPEGKSPYGCYDMAGNIWEWTDTWYDEEKNLKTVKGGSYHDQDFLAGCASRMGFDLLFRTGFILGFRCVKSP